MKCPCETVGFDCVQGRACPYRTRRELPAWLWFIAAIIAALTLGVLAMHVLPVAAASLADPLVNNPY